MARSPSATTPRPKATPKKCPFKDLPVVIPKGVFPEEKKAFTGKITGWNKGRDTELEVKVPKLGLFWFPRADVEKWLGDAVPAGVSPPSERLTSPARGRASGLTSPPRARGAARPAATPGSDGGGGSGGSGGSGSPPAAAPSHTPTTTQQDQAPAGEAATAKRGVSFAKHTEVRHFESPTAALMTGNQMAFAAGGLLVLVALILIVVSKTTQPHPV